MRGKFPGAWLLLAGFLLGGGCLKGPVSTGPFPPVLLILVPSCDRGGHPFRWLLCPVSVAGSARARKEAPWRHIAVEPGSAVPDGGGWITVRDMAGRKVRVPEDPRRIICLGPGTLRQICYLDAVDKVVGVERMEKQWPEGRPYRLANPHLADLPCVGPGGAAAINGEPDVEAVLKVRPEVVFVSYMDASRATELDEKTSIPVVVLSAGRFASFDQDLFESLRIAGKILNRKDRAEQVIAYIMGIREDLHARTSRVPEERRPRVYVGGVGYKGIQGIESTDADYVPFAWIGAHNLARLVREHGHVFTDREQLLAWDPDVIFLDGNGWRLVRGDYERKRSFYQALRAFKEERIYILHPYNWYVTNVETALADAYAAGKILYPREFSDVDPEQKADEIMTFFVGRQVLGEMEKTYGRLGRRLRREDFLVPVHPGGIQSAD